VPGRELGPGMITLEFVRADTLAEPFGALPFTAAVNLSALPVGRAEDGGRGLLRLLGTHVLLAGATGSGKGSVIWSAIRRCCCDRRWLVRSLGAGSQADGAVLRKPIFARYATKRPPWSGCSKTPVAVMHDRARSSAASPAPSPHPSCSPFLVVLVDEMAFITPTSPTGT